MSTLIEQALGSLVQNGIENHLGNLQRGLEKESLRVAPDGYLSQSSHPESLGSTLTHPSITTDYSESLLEFVTEVHNNIPNLLQELHEIHHFTYQHIGEEKLWVNSMPCIVESEEKIPIASYGSSNVSQMKEAYRRGLSHRYGSLMQTIAGIHFNFSLPEAFWNDYFSSEQTSEIQDLKSKKYFDLIRNFHRNSWLGSYLFGASPAVCRTFLIGRQHALEDFDAHSFYAPYATSLRLSGLGYSNEAQANIEICYNGVEEFVKSLRHAIQTPHAEYQQFGVKVEGVYQQLNPNLLQIENEFYSSIRPKRVAASGQSPSRALAEQGVQYVEVRSIDLNPFEPIGIHSDCVRFFDTFLLYCLFEQSPLMSQEEFITTKENQKTMVMEGRNAQSMVAIEGHEINAREAMHSLLSKMKPIAQLLDQVNGDDQYMQTLNKQFNKVEDSDLTPSARIINKMKSDGMTFYEFAMDAAKRSEKIFKQSSLKQEISDKYKELSKQSLLKTKQIEDQDRISFDEFLKDYFERQNTEI